MPGVSGVLPAAAAGIAMAAEVSAGIKIDVNAFNYEKTNGTMKMLTLTHHNQDYESPISFSISGEKAGATYHICEGGGTDINSSKWNIWIKPLDILTVNVGSWDTNLNVETIDWNTYSGIGSAGLTLSLAPVDGITFDATFAPDWNGSLFKNAEQVAVEGAVAGDKKGADAWKEYTDAQKEAALNNAKAAIGEIGVKAAYSADGLGTISAMFDAKNSFHNLGFGAGYKNTFGPATIFVNALGFTANDKFAKVRVEAYAEIPADALSIKAFVAGGYNMEAYDPKNPWDFAYFTEDDKAFVGAKAKIAYSLGGATPYLYISDGNFLGDFKMTIRPGVEFKVGDCSIDAALDVTAAKAFEISVPVKFSMSF